MLTGGFPCQAFSYAGNSLGFEDTRVGEIVGDAIAHNLDIELELQKHLNLPGFEWDGNYVLMLNEYGSGPALGSAKKSYQNAKKRLSAEKKKFSHVVKHWEEAKKMLERSVENIVK